MSLNQPDLKKIEQLIDRKIAEAEGRWIERLEQLFGQSRSLQEEIKQLILESVQQAVAKGLLQVDGLSKSIGSSRPPLRAGLTPTQQDLFEDLDRIESRGAKERKKAQQLILACLPGQKITRALTHALRDYLKSRNWGVRCKCRVAGGILWHKDKRLQKDEAPENRGAMVVSHLDDTGKHVKHLSFTIFPNNFALVERIDARHRQSH